MYRQPEKNVLNSNTSSTCVHNMVNFGPLTAESGFGVWGTPANFNGFRVLAALLHGTLVVGVSQTLRRWTDGAPPIFGRAAITLGIDPHCSFKMLRCITFLAPLYVQRSEPIYATVDYIGWSNVTLICGNITISMTWGKPAYCVELTSEDSHVIQIALFSWFKKMSTLSPFY